MNLKSLMLGAATAISLSTGAMAADYYSGSPATDIYSGAMYNSFEGAYAGIVGGGYLGDVDGNINGGALGIAAGVNFAMSDLILAGLEFQGGLMWPKSGWDWDAYALGHLGFVVTDGVMAYGAAGLGTTAGNGSYAFGGGVEVAAFNPVTVRGEILGVGEWGTAPSAVKATAGVLFHFN
ncbi:MAG TPA: hypothetical protein VGM83_16910 [Devosiaceae bacterium]